MNKPTVPDGPEYVYGMDEIARFVTSVCGRSVSIRTLQRYVNMHKFPLWTDELSGRRFVKKESVYSWWTLFQRPAHARVVKRKKRGQEGATA